MAQILAKLGFLQVNKEDPEFKVQFGKYGFTRSLMAGDML